MYMNILSKLFGAPKKAKVVNPQLMQSSPDTKHPINRQLYLERKVIITNQSGKKAWIIISPLPIWGVSSIGLDKLGQIELSCKGDYICQQSPLSDGVSRTFELDNSKIYYTVFFECDGKWRTHVKDKKHDSTQHDINLLPRHIDESVEFIPK